MKWLLAIGLVLPATVLAGQTTLKVDAKLVAITAVVRDKHGELLPGLTKDDFVLKEDGKLQTIRYFSHDDDLPLQLGLLVDTSGSEREYLDKEADASDTFLGVMLKRPTDKAFLVQFDDNVLLKQRLTSDVIALRMGLLRMNEPHPPARVFGRGTLLFDAIVGTMQTFTRFMDGRRAIVILSDGQDNGSMSSLSDAIQWAQTADTTVYTILYGDDDSRFYLGKYADSNTGHGAMQLLAASTGGHFFKVSKKQPIEAIYEEIAKELRSQYRIGYTPPESTLKTFHRLELTARQKGETVQARTGYTTLR